MKDQAERDRRKMTVCIAASCNLKEEQTLILCSDWQITGALGAAEIAHKTFIIVDGWFFLYSGDTSAAHDVVRRLRANFQKKLPDETDLLPTIESALFARKAL